MKYLSIQTFQCGISVSGAATFTGGATINVLALNGATTSSEASLFLGAHGVNEGGQLVLQKGTGQTYAAHLDNYNDQFRILYGTNTTSSGSALIVNLATLQLVLPAYTSPSSFSGTAAGYLAFDSSGNVITTSVPVSGVSSIIAGTGVTVSSGTGNVTVSIGQSVATSATPSFDQIFLTNNGNGTNVKIGDDAWIGDVNTANTLRIMGQQNNADGYIIFGNSNTTALGRSGTGNLTYGGSTVWTAATLTNLNQLTNGPGYITSAALAGYVPTSRTLTINGTSYDLSADRTWTINTVAYTSRLQHQVKAGVAINKGQAVYVTSADGTNMIVGLASNASEATSSKTMGLLDATVSTNGFANVVTEGLLAGLDTSTAGTEGDPVWLGTGGNLIYGLINKPSAPAHLVFIGIVTRKNNSNGEIFVKVQNGFELNEIHDVDLKTIVPVNGHILGFDGTLWVNKTIAGWLGYTPANASGTTNYLSKFTGSTTLGNSLVYDNGTNVGIGTTTPDSKLHIEGTTTGSGSGADAIVHIKQNGGWNGNEPWALYVEGYSYLNGFRVNAYDTQRSLFSSAGELGFAVSGDSPISFTQNTSDYRMYIASGGQVIVGGTTVGYAGTKLQVGNTSDSQNGLNILTSTTGYGYILFGDGAGADTYVGQIWYYHGDNYMGFQTNGSERMRITAAGNLGIGTSSPSSPGGFTKIVHISGGYASLVLTSTNVSKTWEIGINSSSLLTFYDGSVDRMVINASGNVGIGTTSPASLLHINGTGNTFTRYTNTTNSGHYIDIGANGAGESFVYGYGAYPLLFGTNGSERMRITSGGNVGIGTSSPESISSTTTLTINGSTGGGAVSFQVGGVRTGLVNGNDNYLTIQSYASRPLSLGYNGNNTIVVNTSNNVGIGTTTPTYKLDVSGQVRINNVSGLFIDAAYAFGDNSGGSFDIYNRGTTRALRILSSTGNGWGDILLNPYGANVGIGTLNPTQTLHVEGNLRLTGAFYDSNNSAGTAGQILKSTATGTDWVSLSEITGVDGTGTANYLAKWSDADTITTSLVYDNGTNVGIGTTSPAAKLDIRINEANTNTVPYLNLINDASGYVGYTFKKVGSNDLGLYGNYTTPPAMVWKYVSGTDSYVGIGTTTPAATLQVGNGSTGTNSLYVGGSVSTTHTIGFAVNGNTVYHGLTSNANSGEFRIGAGFIGSGHYIVLASGDNTERMRITPAGNIGIGTTNPSYKLQVVGDGAGLYVLGANSAPYTQTIASFVYGGNGNSINIENQGGKASLQARAAASTMALQLNVAGGNVLVGTSTDSGYNLQVAGNQLITTTGNTSSTTGFKILNSSGSTMFHVLDNGNVGININAEVSSPYSLRVNGGIWANSFEQLQTLNGTAGVGSIEYYNTGGSHRTLGFRTYGSHPAESVKGFIEISSQVLTYTGIGNVVLHADADFADHPTLVLRSLNTSADSFYMQNYHHSQGALFITKAATGGDSSMRFRPGRSSDILVISTSGILVNGVITATGGNSTQWNTAYSWGNHSSAGYVPQARTLTINGTSYDLSANRSWTIANDLQTAANGVKVTTPVNVGPNVIASVSVGSYDGATFNYVIKDGTNYRAGTVIAVWNGTIVQYTETTTNDIGTTTSVVMSVAITAGNAELIATSGTPGWTAKVVPLGI